MNVCHFFLQVQQRSIVVSQQEIECNTGHLRRRQWHPTPVLLPGKSHGWRSLVGCRLWGRTELDTTEMTQQQQQHDTQTACSYLPFIHLSNQLSLFIYTVLKYFKLLQINSIALKFLIDNINVITKVVKISVTQYFEVWLTLLIKCFTVLMTLSFNFYLPQSIRFP